MRTRSKRGSSCIARQVDEAERVAHDPALPEGIVPHKRVRSIRSLAVVLVAPLLSLGAVATAQATPITIKDMPKHAMWPGLETVVGGCRTIPAGRTIQLQLRSPGTSNWEVAADGQTTSDAIKPDTNTPWSCTSGQVIVYYSFTVSTFGANTPGKAYKQTLDAREVLVAKQEYVTAFQQVPIVISKQQRFPGPRVKVPVCRKAPRKVITKPITFRVAGAGTLRTGVRMPVCKGKPRRYKTVSTSAIGTVRTTTYKATQIVLPGANLPQETVGSRVLSSYRSESDYQMDMSAAILCGWGLKPQSVPCSAI